MSEEHFEIEQLTAASGHGTTIAALQFKLWGSRTGHNSAGEYEHFLREAACSDSLPTVLVARRGPIFLGSVNLLISEMRIRPLLSPWMAQLFVTEEARGRGVGNALAGAAVTHTARLGFRRIYLYTSGTLPSYYALLGWKQIEESEYLGKVRTVMAFDLR